MNMDGFSLAGFWSSVWSSAPSPPATPQATAAAGEGSSDTPPSANDEQAAPFGGDTDEVLSRLPRAPNCSS